MSTIKNTTIFNPKQRIKFLTTIFPGQITHFLKYIIRLVNWWSLLISGFNT